MTERWSIMIFFFQCVAWMQTYSSNCPLKEKWPNDRSVPSREWFIVQHMLPRAFGVDLIFLPKCVSMKGVSLEEENIKTKRNNANTPDSSRPSGRGAAQLLPYSLFDDGSPRAEGVSGRHEIVHGICFPSSQSRRDLHRLGRGIKMRPHYKGKGTTLLAPINRLLFSSILISWKQKNVGPEFFEKQLSTKRENV
jgi:hypothetical protein